MESCSRSEIWLLKKYHDLETCIHCIQNFYTNILDFKCLIVQIDSQRSVCNFTQKHEVKGHILFWLMDRLYIFCNQRIYLYLCLETNFNCSCRSYYRNYPCDFPCQKKIFGKSAIGKPIEGGVSNGLCTHIFTYRQGSYLNVAQ